MPEPANIDVVQGRRAAASMLHPMRGRLLHELAEPESAAGLARKLELPRQQINYHLRQLEKEGLVELVEERRRGNCTERVVRATARSYLIGPEALGDLAVDPGKLRDEFSAGYLLALAARAIRDLGHLGTGAERAGKRLPTLSLQAEIRFASAADQNAFAEELAAAVAGLTARYHDETASRGRRFRFFAGAYPEPKAPDEATAPAGGAGATTDPQVPPPEERQ
ncbi:MAG TPA: helix-turn-helix domain-containing protein [Acidobacteriota bacterium]